MQTKLTVSQPGDPYEREAERVADQVLLKIAADGLAPGESDGDDHIQRAEDESTPGNPIIEQINAVLDEDGLQAKSEAFGMNVSADFESKLAARKGSGSPIPQRARALMENAFGADFSHVRLHTDINAADMARDIGAHAFTHGADIYFNHGRFNPSTPEGKRLFAHELTHTIQQNAGELRRLSITRNSRTEGDCGSRSVRWTFTLDNPASGDGYIVQKVTALETIESCPSNVRSISLTPTIQFWEAWPVSAGATQHQLQSVGYTDQSARPPGRSQSGCQASLGTVKFFLKSVTGDLGTYNAAPAASGSSWGPGKAPPSASLPSTTSEPTWWSNTPTEGPVQRWASSWWNCCGDASSQFSRIDSSP